MLEKLVLLMSNFKRLFNLPILDRIFLANQFPFSKKICKLDKFSTKVTRNPDKQLFERFS